MTKCAVTAVIGRPSSGKSTFINTVCETKVSITSPVPQTTRNHIRGIYTDSRGQIIFVDTPGIHGSDDPLNRKLRELAVSAANDCDLILYMIDAKRAPGSEEKEASSLIAKAKPPKVLCVNKTDVATQKEILRAREFLKESFPQAQVLEASALKDKGIDEILCKLFSLAPEGPLLYEPDARTDSSLEFRIGEIIREKAIEGMKDEMPHAFFVEVSDLEYENQERLVSVRAFINVERETQKGIMVGKGGSNIRRIRIEAFKEIRKIFPGAKLQLDLRVKAVPNWRKNEALLKKLIR